MRPQGSGKALQERRERAISLLREGRAPVEVARELGVDRRSVRRWKAAYARQGAAGIRARPTPGRPCKLSPEQLSQLEKMLLEGARAAGFATDLWTCPRVRRVIERSFGVRYHVDHVGRVLHRLGWSPQKPQRKARERDEEAIGNWIKQRWPEIKKKPGG